MILSTATQIIISVIPIVGIVMGGIVAIFYFRWSYKEKIALIEHSLYTTKKIDFDSFSLIAGLLLFFVGLVLTLGFFILYNKTTAVFSGLIPLATGLSLLSYYFIHRIKK